MGGNRAGTIITVAPAGPMAMTGRYGHIDGCAGHKKSSYSSASCASVDIRDLSPSAPFFLAEHTTAFPTEECWLLPSLEGTSES